MPYTTLCRDVINPMDLFMQSQGQTILRVQTELAGRREIIIGARDGKG